jgi:hypothetical protein
MHVALIVSFAGCYQANIQIIGTSALGHITGHISKQTGLFTLGAFLGRLFSLQGIIAFRTNPPAFVFFQVSAPQDCL